MHWRMVSLLSAGFWLAADAVVGGGFQAQSADPQCKQSEGHGGDYANVLPTKNEAERACGTRLRAAETLPDSMNVRLENAPWPTRIQIYPHSRKTGLEVFTSNELSWIGADGVGLRYTGPLQPPLAADLRRLLLNQRQKLSHVVLELDSNGGELNYVKELVAVLQEVKSRMRLTTRVMEGEVCASGCIPLFMQGETRKASGASVWVFHGARGAQTNVPSRAANEDYLSMLSSSGLNHAFRAELEKDNRIYRPGALILSGFEAYEVYKAGIITELLPAWREEAPVLPPAVPSSQ